MIKLKNGGQIEIVRGLPIYMEYLRHGDRTGTVQFLAEGRYIVDHVDSEQVILAPADWDTNGNVTFHSSKHAYMIVGEEGVKELQDALYMMGPKEWRPKVRPKKRK